MNNIVQYQESHPLSLSECGVKDPSWMELNHFVQFLDIQLSSCEKSAFCNEDVVGDIMSGLKTFVVTFMVRMSKVFQLQCLHALKVKAIWSMCSCRTSPHLH